MNDTQPRKVFTMEDNVKTIAFGIKDVAKQLSILNDNLITLMGTNAHKKDDEKTYPF